MLDFVMHVGLTRVSYSRVRRCDLQCIHRLPEGTFPCLDLQVTEGGGWDHFCEYVVTASKYRAQRFVGYLTSRFACRPHDAASDRTASLC